MKLKNLLQTISCAFVACSLLMLTGCGGAADTAVVSGKVLYEGQPIDSGSLTFVPSSGTNGKPTAAMINPDGSYQLGANLEEIGTQAGRMKVFFSPKKDHPENLKPGQSLPASPYDGLIPSTKEVEIVQGTNTVDIELVKAKKRPTRR